MIISIIRLRDTTNVNSQFLDGLHRDQKSLKITHKFPLRQPLKPLIKRLKPPPKPGKPTDSWSFRGCFKRVLVMENDSFNGGGDGGVELQKMMEK
ncbi:unnamed protein product [Dovyalis caffra]|uniref:Uncharacterized protein n=1 Tax=Dovyalis caffra TaxID=77055 RepID=A0AAV1QS59_9ROSI|nr:unnamed protein product [Dovyalis caffra]